MHIYMKENGTIRCAEVLADGVVERMAAAGDYLEAGMDFVAEVGAHEVTPAEYEKAVRGR